MGVPSFDDLFNPVLAALHQLGGSASVSEIEEATATALDLSDEDVAEIHRGSTTKLAYRLAWARNYLKRYGILENSARGIWALTEKGRKTTSVNKNKLQKEVQRSSEVSSVEEEVSEGRSPEAIAVVWQEKLMEELQSISPSAFEKVCQRILREAGFVKVEVTGKTGDGGIDGVGIVRMNGLLSFHIIFQCKRYTGSVSPSQVRDFRGAMQGRADKGLLITTGSFTRDARAEATRQGALHIDLMDGDELVEKMKDLGLGVKVRKEETVEIDKEWFKGF